MIWGWIIAGLSAGASIYYTKKMMKDAAAASQGFLINKTSVIKNF